MAKIKLTKVPFAGTPEQDAKLTEKLDELKGVPGALMPAMQTAQEIYGYLPVEVQKKIADALDVSLEKVFGVATFYSQFSLNPKGQYQISVCLGTACYVKGSGDLLAAIERELNIKHDECTSDGRFSLLETRCIGCCGLAPVLTINEDVYGKLVPADIPGIIEGASAGKGLGLRFLRHIERNSLLLFMVPADSDDIRKEYEILLNELRTFNPEMLDKQRVLAITKCDMLDQELMDEIEPTLPESIPHVFISAISGLGISVLKDILWEELNKESNKIEGKIESIAHRAKDMSHLKEELKDEGEDEDLGYEYIDDEDIEDLEDFEYEEEDWEDDKK